MNTASTAIAAVATRDPERRFYIVMSILALAIAFTSFAPAAVDGASRTAPLNLVVGIHGLLFTSWLIPIFCAESARL